MKVWSAIADAEAGYLFSLSDSLAIVEAKHPDLLFPVNTGTMIIASDYSGQHKEATHEAYSFAVTTDQALREWLPFLAEFRKNWLPDNRRLSFKKLNEPLRWQALPAFLETTKRLRGNLITILIDRRVGSFMLGGPAATIEAFPDCFAPNAKHGTVEKMLRLASFVALILAGLRREDQVSNWISDHDEALDSQEKREQFSRLASYMTFGLTRWQRPADSFFGTTESPRVPYWAEDFAALADLAAGAYCQLSAHLPAFFSEQLPYVGVGTSSIASQRALTIGDWLASGRSSLRHVLLRLEKREDGKIKASGQAFMGAVVGRNGLASYKAL